MTEEKKKPIGKEFAERWEKSAEGERAPKKKAKEKKKEETKELIKKYDEALRKDEKDASMWYAKGVTQLLLDKYSDAIKSFDKAIEIDPNYKVVWRAKAEALVKLNQHTEAILCYDRALKLNPEDKDAWDGKGNVLYKLGMIEDAGKCFEMARKIEEVTFREKMIKEPEKVKKLEIIEEKPEAEKPVVSYEEALKEDVEAMEAAYKRGVGLLAKGFILTQLGRYEDAIECFDKVIKIDPFHKSVWAKKAEVLIKLKRNDEALLCYNRAIELDPKDKNLKKKREELLEAIKIKGVIK